METNLLLNDKILALRSILPSQILKDHFAMRPDMAMKYSDHQKENFKKDVAWILSFLAESVWAGKPVLFEEFISWLKTFLMSIKVPMKDVAESLELIRKRMNVSCTSDENEILNPILDKAVRILLSDDQQVSIPAEDNHLSILAQNYLASLLKGDRNMALSMVLDQIKKGVPVQDIYVEVFQPVQYEIGRLWQTNKISVAQEHYCTAATQLVMSQLYPYLFSGEKKNRKLVTTCVQGELHEMGARMVTDFFEMNGWDTYYLGANMPIESVVKYIVELQPRCLAISATMTFHVSSVEKMIKMIRTTSGVPEDLVILVGGYPFKVAEGLWSVVGANGYAANATEAVKLAEKLTAA
jgi:methanogenic corrinoid protein MtbC1